MSGQIEMPKYKSHKEVWALKIKSVDATTVTPEDAGYAPFEVPEQYIAKHDPKAGGYYVVYEDGYQSFSPAEAFESGYTAAAPALLATRDAAPSDAPMGYVNTKWAEHRKGTTTIYPESHPRLATFPVFSAIAPREEA